MTTPSLTLTLTLCRDPSISSLPLPLPLPTRSLLLSSRATAAAQHRDSKKMCMRLSWRKTLKGTEKMQGKTGTNVPRGEREREQTRHGEKGPGTGPGPARARSRAGARLSPWWRCRRA